MPDQRVALVVVAHDSGDDLLDCLASVDEDPAPEVLVVDSGSRDGSLAEVERRFPAVSVLRLANVGYGQAATAGVARTNTPYVVVANADTRFRPGVLTALAATLDSAPDVALAGPRVVYPDGREQASARRFPSFGTAVGHAVFGFWWPENPWTRSYRSRDGGAGAHGIDWLSGCALAVRRDAFDEVGGFDPAYFMYVEDVDLAWRLRERGWKVEYVPEVEVVHAVGGSTARYGGRLAFEHARNLHRFWRRAYGRGLARALEPLVVVGLAGWAVTAWVWQRWVAPRRGRSTTGE